jgi:hypothetical protein
LENEERQITYPLERYELSNSAEVQFSAKQPDLVSSYLCNLESRHSVFRDNPNPEALKRFIEYHLVKSQDNPNLTDSELEVIRKGQYESLSSWIEYMRQSDYPIWFKYLVLRSVLKLSGYNKGWGEFSSRSKTTLDPFPPIHEGAVHNVYLSILLGDNGRFSRLYAREIYGVQQSPNFSETCKYKKGDWERYSQGDEDALVSSLSGNNTGWCIEKRYKAFMYLNDGDIYVYYDYDENGKKVPRLVIRLKNGEVVEARGILFQQNVDPIMYDVLEKLLRELNSFEKFRKTFTDMRKLTRIHRKVLKKIPLTKKEIDFIKKGDIECFGTEEDPRRVEVLRLLE